jgi:hypothetical protein
MNSNRFDGALEIVKHGLHAGGQETHQRTGSGMLRIDPRR